MRREPGPRLSCTCAGRERAFPQTNWEPPCRPTTHLTWRPPPAEPQSLEQPCVHGGWKKPGRGQRGEGTWEPSEDRRRGRLTVRTRPTSGGTSTLRGEGTSRQGPGEGGTWRQGGEDLAPCWRLRGTLHFPP